MVFTADIGNSSITLAVFDNDGRLAFRSNLSTVKTRCEDEYIILMLGIFEMYGFEQSAIDGAIISSVVPPLSNVIGGAVSKLFGCKPLFVGPGIKTGLDIKIDNHAQLGADLVANTVAASAVYTKPFIVIDMGTATTLTVVNSNSELCGVAILPGVQIALNALSGSTAELPYISLGAPKALLGKNTVDAMNSGVVYGNACMLDGLIDRLCEDFNIKSISTIATGDLANLIIPYCKHRFIYSPNLILEGLYLLYKMNQKKHKPM
ncbi:MAG TPA: type III pantothenate kinase [Clostridiales bacterium]|nr:type III pantothenate kinase [Clostridiales bacterium]